MNQEKILRLFKKFAGDEINLHGLKCIPVGVGELGTPHKSIKEFYPIQFKLENPNDVPYYSPIVGEELFEIVEGFSEYVNLNLESEILLEGKSKLYLNSEVQNEIQKVFDSVREIKFTTGTPFVGYRRYVINIESVGLKTKHFDQDSYYIEVFDSVREIKFTTGTPFVGYRRYVINIESVGLKTANFDEDSYYINNTVVPLSATKNGENIDVNDAINEYIDEFLPHKETYYESEEYYHRVDQVISQYPLLNADYVATYYETKFIR